jgi:hypothetical protein
VTDVEEVDGERMERRVRELLDRAEDFRRHGEDGSADAALALAEKIMLKHSLDAAVIAARRAASGGATESIITRVTSFKGIYRVALAVQFDQLVRAYSTEVRTFISKGEREENLHVIGFESDVSQLQALLTSLNLQAIASLNVWWQANPLRGQLRGMTGYKERRQYVSAFVRGATDRIELARQTALGASEPGTELVLRSRRSAVDEHVEANYRLTMRRTNLYGGSQDAAVAGRDAGRRANTGDTSVGTDRRQITS